MNLMSFTSNNQPTSMSINGRPPYLLTDANGNAKAFYKQIAFFANEVSQKGKQQLGDIIAAFNAFNSRTEADVPALSDEQLVDMLVTGVLWIEYKQHVKNRLHLKAAFLKGLYRIRNTSPLIKKLSDQWRGRLASRWLTKKSESKAELSRKNMLKLCHWLSATNEFNSELKQIKSWVHYFHSLSPALASQQLQRIVDFALWFRDAAHNQLGNYTSGVHSFLTTHHSRYYSREDYFFTSRHEAEYHLNMIGAEMMNQSMRADFLKTERKILLLPSCMASGKHCMAKMNETGLSCSKCTPECRVREISEKLDKEGITTCLIRHTTGFKDDLKKYAKQKHTGIIASACVLNLLMGGLEMKRLNIPAQCVYLNYSACRNHWNPKGIPTNIDLLRIQRIAGNKALNNVVCA